jgi:hypothetical protein
MVFVACLVCLFSHIVRESEGYRHFNSSGRLANSNQGWLGPDASTKQTMLFKSDTDKCVDIPGSDMTNGNKIQIWDCSNNKNQMWYFDGLYIRSGINDQKCLDIPGGDYTNGNKLDLWDCNGLSNQQFKGGGAYQWESVASPGKCIDLYGGDSTNGKLLEIWDCASPEPGRTHYDDPNKHGGSCLSDEAAASFTDIPGDFCSPYCASDGSCPQDKPAGVTATPTCGDIGGSSTKYCLLQCSSDGQCGTDGSCKSNGYCTYDDCPAPAPTPPPPAGQTHYDDPGKGCLSDENQINVPGVPGELCVPGCNSDGSCPQDKPTGVTANPQCVLHKGGDSRCALCCAISLPIRDQKVADSQCGAATCHPYPGQNYGFCTYAEQPKPGQTHYGNPGHGAGRGDCLSDEMGIELDGISGQVCAPLCNSDGSCPQDKPTGVTANPQCAIDTQGNRCALCCAVSLPIRDQKVADSQCGAATCQPVPGQDFGICTYATAIELPLVWHLALGSGSTS